MGLTVDRAQALLESAQQKMYARGCNARLRTSIRRLYGLEFAVCFGLPECAKV